MCVHAGELKRVRLSGQPHCIGLSMRDDLDAFAWRCVVQAGEASFYSTGLRRILGFAGIKVEKPVRGFQEFEHPQIVIDLRKIVGDKNSNRILLGHFALS